MFAPIRGYRGVAVLLVGHMQSGKDTVGEALVRLHGFRRVALADRVKVAAHRLVTEGLGYSGVALDDFHDNAKKSEPVAPGATWVGKPLTPRWMCQWLGTELGKQCVGDHVWVDALVRSVSVDETPRVVITDVRFSTELAELSRRLWDRGFAVVSLKVVDEDATPDHSHASEREIAGIRTNLEFRRHKSRMNKESFQARSLELLGWALSIARESSDPESHECSPGTVLRTLCRKFVDNR